MLIMKKNILVLEDEPAIADTIIYALESEGFSVKWCTTTKDARDVFQQFDIQFVVLDIGLPDGNGFDFCRELRKKSDVPVLFLTARRDEIDRIIGLEIGGDDYMVKPFSPRELTARIRAILRRTVQYAASPSNSTGTYPFTLDDHKKSITYHDQPLILTRYEYRIMKIFIERPGWIFSRDQIMSRVWEEPDSSFDRTVDTHIKSLRAKLDKIKPETCPIQTHRGQGYSLKESM